MQQATLYILVGYPGSGKTTTSQIIHDLTGAEHMWADKERRDMFGNPTHSATESHQLYEHLNGRAEQLLAAGKSAIFDTNFNFRKDRDKLRQIAAKHGAETKLLWVKVDKNIARERATTRAAEQSTRIFGDMSAEVFERLTGHLQEPAHDEKPIIIDGTNKSPAYIAAQIGLPVI